MEGNLGIKMGQLGCVVLEEALSKGGGVILSKVWVGRFIFSMSTRIFFLSTWYYKVI